MVFAEALMGYGTASCEQFEACHNVNLQLQSSCHQAHLDLVSLCLHMRLQGAAISPAEVPVQLRTEAIRHFNSVYEPLQ